MNSVQNEVQPDAPERSEPRDAILRAVLELAAERGLSSLTVRALAARAGVAVGAVNYHFGSKEAAVEAAYAFVTGRLREAFSELEGAGEPEARLRRFARRFAAEVRAYGPALAYFAANGALAGGPGRGGRTPRGASGAYREFALGPGLDAALAVMRELRPRLDRAEAARRLSAFAGALLYPELVPGALGVDHDDPKSRKAYVELSAGLLVADRKERV